MVSPRHWTAVACILALCFSLCGPAKADQPANTFVEIYDTNQYLVAHGGTYDPPLNLQPYTLGTTHQNNWQVTVDYPGGETGVKLLAQLIHGGRLANQPGNTGQPDFALNWSAIAVNPPACPAVYGGWYAGYCPGSWLNQGSYYSNGTVTPAVPQKCVNAGCGETTGVKMIKVWWQMCAPGCATVSTYFYIATEP